MINILTGIDSTSSALNAERIRMDVVSQNIANVNTTRGPNGRPYARQQVVFEAVLSNRLAAGPESGSQPMEVRVPRVQVDSRAPRMVFQPGHPHADNNGMVAMPNINMYEEMVDLTSASRAYEANLGVVKTARAMALQTMAIGKR
jgi:flagellar basal-body rod protein FlgC